MTSPDGLLHFFVLEATDYVDLTNHPSRTTGTSQVLRSISSSW